MSTAPGLLESDEYERRKQFLDEIKCLTKSEYIEIVRILKKHDAQYSENDNGVFVNLTNLSQDVFDSLELFMEFTKSNQKNLTEREIYLSTLVQTSSNPK